MTYNRVNLCDEFCNEHGLLTDPALREKLEAIDLESPRVVYLHGLGAEVVEGVLLPPPTSRHRSTRDERVHSSVGAALSRIYAKEYQGEC